VRSIVARLSPGARASGPLLFVNAGETPAFPGEVEVISDAQAIGLQTLAGRHILTLAYDLRGQ
jgi:hypothetical protein